MTLEEDRALTRSDYWDGRYAHGEGHEWFRTYEDLEAFFQTTLFDNHRVSPKADPLILHLGSGDSVVPARFAARGYTRQLCLDFSTIVVKMMAKAHAQIRGIEWKWADIRNMDMIQDQSIDVAVDKGTLDAMVYGSGWNPPDEVKNNTRSYMNELHRVLKDDGLFLYITFRQPRFIQPLLNPDGTLWHLEMQELSSGGGTFPYYGYVIRKKTSLDDETDAEANKKDTPEPNDAPRETEDGENGTRPSANSSSSSEVDPESLGVLWN